MSREVDIIVVYWETDFMIEKCINQLLKTDYDNYKICIVDNTWKSEDKLKSYFDDDRINVIQGRNPLERSKSSLKRGRQHVDGVQIGINNTDSEYVAIFHADSWPLRNCWLKESMKYINQNKVEMVGIQHESSIHSCFHFVKRSTLKNMKYKYNRSKVRFSKSLIKNVKYKDAIKSARTKWDWGEDLAIKIYGRHGHTVGFNPTKGASPEYGKDDINKQFWRNFGQDGFGIVYGDMFFHIWKSFRKMSLDKIEKYKKYYENDEYLNSYYFVNKVVDKVVLNKGIHDNSYYLLAQEEGFEYKG